MRTSNLGLRTSDYPLLPGYKLFSLVLWKQAVELLQQQPKLSAFAMAGILSCTENTAKGMLTDYRKMKRRTPKSPKGDFNTKVKKHKTLAVPPLGG